MQIFVSNPLNFILLLLSNLLLFHTKIHADYLTQKCTDSAIYTSNSPFETNLQKLFSSISTNAPPTGFSNASSGNDPDRVYGLAQCRGDVDVEICKSCVDSAIKKIQEACPNKKSGIIWFRDCLVRYSHEDFLGNVDVSSRIVIWNVNNKSEEENRSNHARVLVDRLVGESSSSPMMFAIGYVTLDDGEVRYGLVQCTRDLSPHNCSSCLVHLAKNLEDCCGRRREWHILAGSCVICYHAYNMIDTSMPTREEGDSTPTRQEVAGVGIISQRKHSRELNKHHKRRTQISVVIISVAAALAAALLVIYLFYLWWTRKGTSKYESNSGGEKNEVSRQLMANDEAQAA